MSGLVFEDFQPHAGAVFILHDEDLPPLELTLETVDALKAIGLPGVRRSFSLIFRCAEQRALEGRIYCLAHPAMGEVDIYLSPVARDANGVQYQALFN
jgi:hypothetical protein